MEKVYTTEKCTHMFYCDNCGKELGSSHEYDDGWFQEIGEYTQTIFIDGDENIRGRYTLKANYCPTCKAVITGAIVDELKILGFDKE